MPAGEVSLGSIHLTGKGSRLSLALESSFAIWFPNTTRTDLPTATEISEASASGQLWISKAGSCRLDFMTLMNDKPLEDSSADPTMVSMIANLAAECQVWEEIGLELRLKHTSETKTPEHQGTAYFLHHPDLSSGLIAPHDVTVAHFQGLKCKINLLFEIIREETRGDGEEPDAGIVSREEPLQDQAPRHNHGLRKKPTRSAKGQEAMESACWKPKARRKPALKTKKLGDIEDLDDQDIAEMACLLDAGLRKLIGIKKASPGIKIIRTARFPALIEVAPAVWDLQYLQSMAVHASIIPTIASGLSRLTNARSGSLRDKLERLTRGGFTDDSQKPGAGENASEEIKKRLWLSCQTKVQADPTKRLPSHRRINERHIGSDAAEWEMTAQYEVASPTDESSPNAFVDVDCHENEAEAYPFIGSEGELLDLPVANNIYQTMEPESGRSYDEPTYDQPTCSSEGDYFFMDTEGNLVPVEEDIGTVDDEEELEEWGSDYPVDDFHANDELEGDDQRYINNNDVRQGYLPYGEEGCYTTHSQEFAMPEYKGFEDTEREYEADVSDGTDQDDPDQKYSMYYEEQYSVGIRPEI